MKRLSAGGKSVRPQNGFRAKDKIMKRCKITILQRTLNEKLAREYAAPGFTKCPMMREGQVFYACNDGLRPVIMKIERTDEGSSISYEPVE